MKKKLALLLAVLLAAGSMAACGKDDQNNKDKIYLKDINAADYVSFSGDYKGHSFDIAPMLEPTEEDAKALCLSAAAANLVDLGEGVITKRAVEDGDIINMDYVGRKDGVEFEGGSATDAYLYIGSGMFIDGFESGLIGVMPGETVELNLTFPDGYSEELSNAEVVFTVTVNYIYSFDQITEEHVQQLTDGEYTTIDQFLDYANEYLAAQYEEAFMTNFEPLMAEVLESMVTVKEIPEGLVKTFYDRLYTTIANQASYYGTDVENYCSTMMGMTAEEYITPYAQEEAKLILMMQYIADKEGLNITDDKVVALAEQYQAYYGFATIDEVYAVLDFELLRETLMYSAVLEFLADNSTFTAK